MPAPKAGPESLQLFRAHRETQTQGVAFWHNLGLNLVPRLKGSVSQVWRVWGKSRVALPLGKDSHFARYPDFMA